jgi:hypothetical protein
VVLAAKIPLDIKNARNARSADGSVLEYGLGRFWSVVLCFVSGPWRWRRFVSLSLTRACAAECHLKNFKGALDKGLPNEPRFPERDNKYIADMGKRQELLSTWLETFRSALGQHEEASSTITVCCLVSAVNSAPAVMLLCGF